MHKQLNLLEYATKAQRSAGQPNLVLSQAPDSAQPPTASPQPEPDSRLDSDVKAAGRVGIAHARAALEAGRVALAEAKQTTPVARPVHPGRPSTLLPAALPAAESPSDETELPRAA